MCTEELEKRDGALGAKRKLQKAVTNVQLQRSAQHSHHGKKGVPHLASLDFSERLALMMTPRDVVADFLTHELRMRRLAVQPKLAIWRVHMDEYYEEVRDWRLMMEVRISMKERTKDDANPDPPPMQPGCPTHLPNDEEIRELVLKCRKEPNYRAPLPKENFENEEELEEKRKFDKQVNRAPSKDAPTKNAGAFGIAQPSARDFMPKIMQLEKFGLVPNLAAVEDPLSWVLSKNKRQNTATETTKS